MKIYIVGWLAHSFVVNDKQIDTQSILFYFNIFYKSNESHISSFFAISHMDNSSMEVDPDG